MSLLQLGAVSQVAKDTKTGEGRKNSLWSRGAKEVRALCIVRVQEAESDELFRDMGKEDKSVDITLPYDKIRFI